MIQNPPPMQRGLITTGPQKPLPANKYRKIKKIFLWSFDLPSDRLPAYNAEKNQLSNDQNHQGA